MTCNATTIEHEAVLERGAPTKVIAPYSLRNKHLSFQAAHKIAEALKQPPMHDCKVSAVDEYVDD